VAVEEARHYSQRLGVITSAQLNAVAEQFGLGRITDAWPPAGGLFGQNVMLVTTAGRYVFRGNPHGQEQLTKERCVARLIHQGSTLPAPWPYRICDDPTLFGWTYAVMPMLAGSCGQDLWAAADAGRCIELAATCGRALAMLHEVVGPSPASYEAPRDDFVPVTGDFTSWWLERFDHWRVRCRQAGALSADDERFIDDVIARDLSALAEPFTPALVHHDFKPGNLNVVSVAESFEPSGVFDLFEAYFGDPEEDLVRMLWTVETDDQRRAFIEGYAEDRALRDGAADRLELYSMADWLIAWEYGKRNRIWFEDVTFTDSVRPILANARTAGSWFAGGA